MSAELGRSVHTCLGVVNSHRGPRIKRDVPLFLCLCHTFFSLSSSACNEKSLASSFVPGCFHGRHLVGSFTSRAGSGKGDDDDDGKGRGHTEKERLDYRHTPTTMCTCMPLALRCQKNERERDGTSEREQTPSLRRGRAGTEQDQGKNS